MNGLEELRPISIRLDRLAVARFGYNTDEGEPGKGSLFGERRPLSAKTLVGWRSVFRLRLSSFWRHFR